MNGKRDQAKKRYMPGIDGLRAISVLAVIAYHLDLKWAQGGLLGVGVFFVLSGYLITDQLLMEWKWNKNILIWSFWMKRFRRLLPAMLSMLLVVTLWFIVTDPNRLLSLLGDFITSIFYVNNWYLIFHEVSYFESFGPASPIGHLWSLSIEEQFYVIWPIVLLIGLRFAPRRGVLLLWMLSLATISAVAMTLLYEPGTDPSRVYYGTDTRAFAILIGAGLAVGWPSWKLGERISPAARTSLDVIGTMGLLVLILLIYRTNEYDDALYQYGFVYLSLITALLIAVLVHPLSRLGKLLGCRPLTWLGKHSYSLYIWHYPVIILMTPEGSTEGLSFGQIVLRLIIILLLSILSYEFIEEPIRRGNFRAKWRSIWRHERFKPMFGLSVTLIAFFIAQSWISDAAKIKFEVTQPVNMQHAYENEDQDTTLIHNPLSTESAEEKPPVIEDHQPMNREDNGDDSTSHGGDITLIGDSITLDIDPYIQELLPGIVVDGKVGRQMTQAQQVLDDLQARGQLGEQIIIELGSNGVFNKSKLRSLLDSTQDKQLYLVTTRVPRTWQDSVNSAIKEIASEYTNVEIIDWYSASENKSELFAHDGVHLTPEGSKYYASLLAEHLQGLR
ncbi:acyltransferase family protein [Paenibacillus illinoisensis]|uniref:acyltransferase family protein n=1 Tax=Paenibacillus illinoisensis TaxID=59845 RepID=UPI003018AD96